MTARPFVAKLRRAALTAPYTRGWRAGLVESSIGAAALAVVAAAGGLVGWPPVLDARLARLAAVALVAPALGEELLFRVAMMPPVEAGRPFPLRATAVSTGAFVLWHPLQAVVFGPRWAEVVLDPFFLCAVALLGWTCCRLYWRTASIWPGVLLHWSVVVAWKAFGGPSPWEAG